MTWFELRMRVNHLFTAKHYRGHGIHSPFLYDFIRSVLVDRQNQDVIQKIETRYLPRKTQLVNSLDGIDDDAYIAILDCPFSSKMHYYKWLEWRKTRVCTSVQLKNHMILFFDSRLPNKHFKIRSR